MEKTLKSNSKKISIHALREEGDLQCLVTWSSHRYFYPRPPRGGRLRSGSGSRPVARYFYPRPPRGGRRTSRLRPVRNGQISIHALREEGDIRSNPPKSMNAKFLSTPSARRATFYKDGEVSAEWEISIHALREEGDRWHRRRTAMSDVFLSTPSARRATCRGPAPRYAGQISIHALREEGDGN